MEIRPLSTIRIETLLETLNAAFADYIVPFQLSLDQLRAKIKNEDVDLDWSIGVFDDGELVAFIMHGRRTTNGQLQVYNAGTGVIPDYRGQGLVAKMYDYSQPFFQEKHVKHLLLEVIEGNSSAIRAYEKNGFAVARMLRCFRGEVKGSLPEKSTFYAIRPLIDPPWSLLQSFWDIQPSWQSANASMEIMQPQALGAYLGDELVGYALYNPSQGRLYQLAVIEGHRRNGIATQLLLAIREELREGVLQINNVDQSGTDLASFFEKMGLVNHLNQFEMQKEL